MTEAETGLERVEFRLVNGQICASDIELANVRFESFTLYGIIHYVCMYVSNVYGACLVYMCRLLFSAF